MDKQHRHKTNNEIAAIDEKTLKISQNGEINAIHMVSVWANKNQLVSGQVKTGEKSNEITAIPTSLELLDLRGCIVTIDAMGCQKEIAKKIVEQEADYVFGLKGNQNSLYEDVCLYFETGNVENRKVINGKGHGRFERRAHFLEADVEWLSQKFDWSGLNAVGMVGSTVEEKGKITEETLFLLRR